MVQGGDFVKVGFQSFICWHSLQPLSAFRPKIVYSYVIEVADSESDLGLHSKCSSFEDICILPHLKMHEVDQDVVVMYACTL